MSDNGESKLFPLFFYDGNCEFNIGHVNIHSSLDYKKFQSILSEKIGISPNQMSIYLVDQKNTKLLHQDQRKILITGKASFRVILHEKDCAVLVVLKRSRRDRRRRSRLFNAELSYFFNRNQLSPDFFLLRRNVPDCTKQRIPPPVYFDDIGFDNLKNQRDEYVPIVSEASLYDLAAPNLKPKIAGNNNYMFCEECLNAKRQGSVPPFHLCVNDAVVVSFRSPAGPIARPAGRSL